MPAESLDNLIDRVLLHRDERHWGQFHTPKELAISLCVESAKLLALMQWKSPDEVQAALATHREKFSDEIADVFHSLLLIADELKIDLSDALQQKLIKDAKKYPIDKSKGKNLKYTEL